MAYRIVSIVAALFVAGLIIGPVAAVLMRGGGPSALSSADWAALRFSVWQAFLSAALSVGFAVPVARALARQNFPGRKILITLMGAPFILPVIVAVLGLLAVFGGQGWLNSLLNLLGLPRIDVYGLQGILLAHVFFNLPLAVRMILHAWMAVPAERFRLAASLGTPVWDVIEKPMLWRVCPGAFAIIFVICSGSFAVALTLGGGPRATTVELAIYQAFRFEFDLSRAATLATLQLALGLAAALMALGLAQLGSIGTGMGRFQQRWDGRPLVDTFWIGSAALFLLVPLVAIALAGFPGLSELSADVWHSALRSLVLALGATVLTLALAIPLASRAGEAASLLGLSVSGLVLGTGLFLILRPFLRPGDLALPVTMIVNALMALPFVLRAIGPALADCRKDYGRLSEALGLSVFARFRYVFVPVLRRPVAFGLGLTAALSMGDLGVIALFADADNATLPLQIYRLMGSYRMEEAAGAALLLLVLSLGLFWGFDRLGRGRA